MNLRLVKWLKNFRRIWAHDSEKIIIGIFLLIIYLPCILFFVSKVSNKKMDVELNGFFDTNQYPEFSFSAFFDKTYQESVTSYFNSTFLPRGIFIKTYNSVQYSCFDLGNRIIGKNKDIYEEPYILAELCIGQENDYSLKENKQELAYYVDTLEEVQQKLSALEKTLFVYVTPSKTSYFRDNIPPKYLDQYCENKMRCVDCFKELMMDTDIPFLYTLDIGNSLEYPTFYTTGIHWSRTFEQKVSCYILNELSDLTSKRYRTFEIDSVESSDKPYSRDSDVYDLLNVWFPIRNEMYYQFKTNVTNITEYDNMNFLIQGGSFASGLRSDILEHWSDENIKMIDYSNWIVDNMGNFETINGDWEKLHLEEWLEDIDCIVIELNESYIHNYSDGFIDYLNNILNGYF